MNIVAAYDKTLFYNETSKYCVLRLKTADPMVPENARDKYRFADHLIRFVAVGYDLPRTGRRCFVKAFISSADSWVRI